MTSEYSLTIEKINKSHDCKSFECGNLDLDTYLKKYARQNDKLGIGKTFVAVWQKSKTVVAYYTLSSTSIESALLPEQFARKLPRYPVPSVLIARLAVDNRYHGNKIGEYLLMDAFYRILSINEQIGIFAVVVDAIDENARQFYIKYGFDSFIDDKQHLVISLKAIREAFK